MKIALVAVACLLTLASAAAQEKLPVAKTSAVALEAHVQKLWAAFKAKDKAALAASLSDNFREFEEDTSAFGDKQTEVGMVDDFDLISYTLKDFTVKSLGPNSALVTYVAHYESKSGGQTAKADSVFGEVWTREANNNDWEALYIQETYVKQAAAK
jgi:ketosteroid isomerase-like protein